LIRTSYATACLDENGNSITECLIGLTIPYTTVVVVLLCVTFRYYFYGCKRCDRIRERGGGKYKTVELSDLKAKKVLT
jgi:hypothetical protein